MTLLEYKKLWALPADIRAREKRIQVLRKKLDDGFEPKLIHTVRGVGYVLRKET